MLLTQTIQERTMELQDIIRHHFRVTVQKSDKISIKVNGVEYEIVDMGLQGIGISLTPEDIFLTVEDFLDIELNIDGIIHKLEGKIVHISPQEPEVFLCGIEFIKLDKKTKQKLIDYIKNYRSHVLKDSE